jgi:hemerythrin-like metal-binding protein
LTSPATFIFAAGRSKKALFRMAEQLFDAIKCRTTTSELSSLFARLASYARLHFEDEEALMRSSGYPEYEQHRREHFNFTSKVSTLEWEFETASRVWTWERWNSFAAGCKIISVVPISASQNILRQMRLEA